MVRKLKRRIKNKVTSPKVIKSKTAAVVMSMAGSCCPVESGQGDGETHSGGKKESQVPPILLAGLISTASKARKNERNLAITQCGSGELENYKPSRTNIAKMKLEGQLDVVEYSRITGPESVHMGKPCWWLCGDAEGKKFSKRTFDDMA